MIWPIQILLARHRERRMWAKRARNCHFHTHGIWEPCVNGLTLREYLMYSSHAPKPQSSEAKS